MNSKSRSMQAVSLLAIVLLLGTFANAFASASGPADRDLIFDAAGGAIGFNGDANTIRVLCSGVGTCVPQVGGAFSIDVSNPSSSHAAEYATLTLTVKGVRAGNQYPMTLKLLGTTADISEDPVTSTPLASLAGADLESSFTLNAAPAVGSTITFPTSAKFVQEVNDALPEGDGRLTVLVEISGAGTGTVIDYIDFYAHEGGSATAPQFAFEGPLSVQVTTLSTSNAAPTWPLYAGLGAVALLVVAGLAISRRRTA